MDEHQESASLPVAVDDSEKKLQERRELFTAFELVLTSLENSTITGKIAAKYTTTLEIVGMFRDGLARELRGIQK